MPLPYSACIHELYVKPQFVRQFTLRKRPARVGRSFHILH